MGKNHGRGAGLRNIIFLFLLFSLAVGFCFAADPVEGFWLSVDDKTGQVTAGWHIYSQGNTLFGKLLSTADHPQNVVAERCKDSYPGFPVAGKVSQMTVVGTPWIYGLSMEKPGEWGNGHVVNPEDGRVYRCRIIYRTADGKKHKSDVLEMRGEIGLGIGRSQFWQKSDQQTASSLGPR
jgi:uncharacterized protein (DUF2147 family)